MKAAALGFGLLATLVASAAEPLVARPVELTMQELVELYDVPVTTKPAYKFEWDLGEPRYVCAVIDRRKSKLGPWQPLHAYPYSHKVRVATLLLHFVDLNARTANPDGFGWYLHVQIGGASVARKGSVGSLVVLPRPELDYTYSSKPKEPDELFVLNSGEVSYRVRLETSDTLITR